MDMSDEGWACHDCSLDPPDGVLVRELEAFEAIEQLSDEFVTFRSRDGVHDRIVQLHRSYQFAVWGSQFARWNRRSILEKYAAGQAAGYLHYLQTVRQSRGRAALAISDRMRHVVVDAEWVVESTAPSDFDAVDRLVLERGTPRANNPTESELAIPASMLAGSYHGAVRDLGPALRRPRTL
jgi:hypothetical protein